MTTDERNQHLDELEVREADVSAGPTTELVRRGSTFHSFRYRDFTLFWIGSFISNTGSWMQNYALAIVVYSLRRSELDSGLVNFVAGIPILLLSLPAGAIADRFDKRRLLMVSQGILLLQAAALAMLYSGGHLSSEDPVSALVWIGALGLIGGVMSALTFPAWLSLLPDLVPKSSLLNAIALNSAQFQSARLLGPLAAAGLVLVGATMGDIFWVNAASFVFVIASLWAIRPHPESAAGIESAKPPEPAVRTSSWQTLTAGLTYARENRVVGLLLLSTVVMTIFGMPYMMLLPAYADKVLGGGETETAYLMAANGLGAVVGALFVAGLPKNTNRERMVPFGLLGLALMLIAFSLSRWLWLSLVISAFAGAGVLTVNSLSNTSIQVAVPGALRGRVMALFVMSFMGLMPVSSLIFGPIGEAAGPAMAILGGAIVLLGWSLFLIARPGLLQPDEPPPRPA